MSYPMLPEPTAAIVDHRDLTAFIQSSYDPPPIGPQSLVKSIWSVGTHNLTSDYSFTTIETAVESAYKFCDVDIYAVHITLNQMMIVLLVMLVCLIGFIVDK